MNQRQIYKIKLEDQLLGACIYWNAYPSIAGVLRENCFSNNNLVNRGLIWKAIKSLYLKDPIDLMSVNRWLYENENKNYTIFLAKLAQELIPSSFVKSALELLEIIIRQMAVLEMAKKESWAIGELDFQRAAAYRELRLLFENFQNDVFESLIDGINYLESCTYTEGVNVLNKLYSNIVAKAVKMKQYDHFDHLADELERCSVRIELGIDERNTEAVRLLLKTANYVMHTEVADESLLAKILEISFYVK